MCWCSETHHTDGLPWGGCFVHCDHHSCAAARHGRLRDQVCETPDTKLIDLFRLRRPTMRFVWETQPVDCEELPFCLSRTVSGPKPLRGSAAQIRIGFHDRVILEISETENIPLDNTTKYQKLTLHVCVRPVVYSKHTFPLQVYPYFPFHVAPVQS